jgi:hypothetical protein
VGEGFSRVEFYAIDRMAVDESVMIYGRFVFRLVDYAAMIEVDYPNVVLGDADVLFMLPVRTGDTFMAEAKVGISWPLIIRGFYRNEIEDEKKWS